MSVVSSVDIDGVSITILPGTYIFDAKPVYGGRRQNEPLVVIGWNYVCEFDADDGETGVSGIVNDAQKTGSTTVTVTGFPTIGSALISVSESGTGIQVRKIRCEGTKSST